MGDRKSGHQGVVRADAVGSPINRLLHMQGGDATRKSREDAVGRECRGSGQGCPRNASSTHPACAG